MYFNSLSIPTLYNEQAEFQLTEHTNNLDVFSMCFLPDDGPEMAETYRK